jgi:hypothetical protein
MSNIPKIEEEETVKDVSEFLKEHESYLEKSQIDLIKFYKQHFYGFHLFSHIQNEKLGKNPETTHLVIFRHGNATAQGQLIIEFKVS